MPCGCGGTANGTELWQHVKADGTVSPPVTKAEAQSQRADAGSGYIRRAS